MLPFPLIIVIGLVGFVMTAIIVQAVVTSIINIAFRKCKPTPPLSACEQENTNDIL